MKKLALLLLTIIAAIVVPAAPASAAPRIEVVAQGLDNPRGLTVGPGGMVLVAEAGRAGVGPCVIGSRRREFCLSATGAVSAIFAGRQLRVASGLPSLGLRDGAEVVGPQDVVLTPGAAIVSIGLGTDPARRAALGAGGQLIGQLVRIDGDGVTEYADLAGYETANSNPYGLLATSDGGVVATDANGDDLVAVDRTGKISTLADFPVRSGPVAVVKGLDGAYYVGQRGRAGGSRVWKVVPGQEPSVFVDGFTGISDLSIDRRGRLLVLDQGANALVRVERNGSKAELLKTLVNPTGVVAAPDGSIYVSNRGSEVVRIRL